MNAKISRLLVIMILSLGMVLPMLAQRQTGSVVGTVTEKEGQVLPGVGVTAKSPALIISEMTALTNEQGIYRFPSLPPGTYSITYTMDGMETLVREGIIVSVGQTVTLDVSLQFKTLQESVVVVGESPQIDIKKSGRATVLDTDFIKAIPAGRELASYVFMAPGMVREEGTSVWLQGTSGVGSSVRDNQFSVDGISLNDGYVGTQQMDIAMDIMSEVSVETGGLKAEYGGVSGAYVNVISKSGGNKLSGSAAFYYRNRDLQSNNTKGTRLAGDSSGINRAYEPSVTLGGPILKDKIWFFLGASYINTSTFVSGFPYDKPQNVPTVQATPHAFGKFSFQPDQNNRFILSYNFSREFNSDFFATSFDTEQTTIKMKNPIHAANFVWTRFFSASFFVDLKVNYANWSMNYDSQEGQTGPSFTDLISNRNSGGAAAKYHFTQLRFNPKVDATLFADGLAGSHEFKAGVDYNATRATNSFQFFTEPKFGFSSILTMGGTPLLAVKYYGSDSKDSVQSVSCYGQDTWTIGKRLTLNLGARLAYQWVTIPAQNQNEGPISIDGIVVNRGVSETFRPLKFTNIDPRIGLIFDVTGDSKTIVKASYGRYTEPLRGFYNGNFNPNGLTGAVYLVLPDLTPLFPVQVFNPVIAKTKYGDHKIKAPYTHEFTISLEREIFRNWAGGIRYIRKLSRNNIYSIDAAQLDIERLLNNGELDWTNWEQVPFTDPTDGQQKFFWSQKQIGTKDPYLMNPPGANRNFNGVEVTLTKRYSEGWFMMASYIWAKLDGLLDPGYIQTDPANGIGFFSNPNAHVNALGRLEMDRRHQFKFQGLVRGPWEVNLSAFVRYMSGSRYTRMLSSAQLGIPVAQGTAEINAETRGSEGLPARFTVDLRLEKEFKINAVSFGVFADAFNLLNSNKALQAYAFSNNPGLPFNSMLRIENPRAVRLGARLSF